ncbi:MAG TPA: quaternary ammonium compound efflux SMR transporter SugE [Longimicrobium sp.]|nr:quaternary ammonium compound efflux SMR transporter SugE [Longimicrobium sp.]
MRTLIPLGTTPHHPEEGMAWVVLFVAGLFEIGWAVGLKYTEGFTRLWPTVGSVVSMIVSLGLLGVALRTLPLGTAYAVWTGVGTIGTVLLGIALFGESASAMRLACVGLILAGIVGLKLVPAGEKPGSPAEVETEVVAESGADGQAP